MQVQREVASIISSANPGFGLGLDQRRKDCFSIFIFIKSRTAVTCGRSFDDTLAQILKRCLQKLCGIQTITNNCRKYYEYYTISNH